MDKFENQFQSLDAQSEMIGATMNGSSVLSTPQNEIDLLMQQVADEANLELGQQLGSVVPGNKIPGAPEAVATESEDLAERLAKLRNS